MTTAATAALDKVLHLSTLVSADMARFQSESGLTGSRIHLLWMLGLSGPVTQQALASALEVSPRNVTGLVDALVASGHVTREPHPHDRRARLITPTPLGQQTIGRLRSDHQELADQLFGAVPSAQLATFVATLEEITATFARLMEAAR